MTTVGGQVRARNSTFRLGRSAFAI